MKLLCKIGIHNWVVIKFGSWLMYPLGEQTNLYRCARCQVEVSR